MDSWRDAILDEFVPNASKLTLVADPDSLLTEEKLAIELRERGFELIEFNDPVEFRYAYESKYRSIWDLGEQTDLVVILRLQDTELAGLPYDLLQVGRQLSFNLGELFHNLSYPVIESLDRGLFDILFAAQHQYSPERMGDNATRDFILRHVFGIAAELISNDAALLRVLLHLHYRQTHLPQSLVDRVVQLLSGQRCFQSWPLEVIVGDAEAFFAFLQERWPVFLERVGSNGRARELPPEYNLSFSGPDDLPFDHQDIKVYIDNLFVEGKLTPVQNTDLKVDAESWIRCGIDDDQSEDENVRFTRLFDLVKSRMPGVDSRYSDWTDFSLNWAELSSLVHTQTNKNRNKIDPMESISGFQSTINEIFRKWLNKHYASLINLPPSNPAMLHHVPRHLARDIEEEENGRVALLVLDGLALDQWVTIRHLLQEQDHNLVIRESATFAWIPTLTSVSRQSIFSGKPPLYFPATINSTNSEGKLWKQFWENAGLSRFDIVYQRGLGDGDAVKVLGDIMDPGKTRALGLVIDKVDKIMHGMQLGTAGMHNQVQQWCKTGFLQNMIDYLLNHDYQVWLTADHGNIECHGKGRPSEGVIAETRGERVRVYPTPELRASIAEEFTFAKEWSPAGLPSNYYPLVTTGTDAFVKKGDSIVGHGGISMEEVIVPLIKFERRAQ